MNIKIQIQKIIQEEVKEIQTLSKGDHQWLFAVQTETQKLFVKASEHASSAFQKEAMGLEELKIHYGNIPEVVAFSENFLILPLISTESPKPLFWQNLGVKLAQMHKAKQPGFGWREDNFIGQAAQKNKNLQDLGWPEFFWKNRIEDKLKALIQSRQFELDKSKLLKLKDKIHGVLSKSSCHPSLVHGDLWSGNIVCGQKQQAFLIDPAVYYGDREVDLAMTQCFGGFSHFFFKAYQETYPLSEGYEKRKHIYNLFHWLNHFVIFGNSYETSVIHSVERIIHF